MQKPQDDWPQTARAIEEAIKSSGLDDSALANASGADYFAVRRMRRQGIKSRSKNARKLCVFFNLDSAQSDLKYEVAESESLQRLIHATWDGTAAHRRLLEEMLAVASRYRVRPR